ncbi:acyltransferase family protein [Enterococcus hirae]|nr:acyltransferase family protein [Enterococcus hirae]
MDNKNQKLFIAQFIATICVVVIHCGTITNHPIVHFFLKSMVCRIAVPFFFVNNAYFFRINSKREGYSKMWLRRIVRLYTIVFLLYIPFGVQLLQDTVDIQWNLWSILLALVVSFLYTGSFYHLWYFPALISSLAIVKYMFQRFRYK